MRVKNILLIATLTICTIAFANTSEKPKKEIKKASIIKNCCSFSGNFKYNGKWEFGGKFTINFGLAGTPPNGGGNSDTGWGEIFLGENATHGNYLIITPPKEYIGRTIEIVSSNIVINKITCGQELLQFINLKAKKSKIVLKEKTIIKIVNLPKLDNVIHKKLQYKKQVYKKR
ncbi:hypothetical protein [Tenacibaculum haliotis]|uniref:hypothetical protein n=1 Tax=Tenacibaculum haliotis TaxID=1888914 RepID=UPI0021AFF467|nr:hypothetical protein [Tenacibaculum haliotis]MCT4699433.1 hypothetical protein [Tenacibaculum haliotis]